MDEGQIDPLRVLKHHHVIASDDDAYDGRDAISYKIHLGKIQSHDGQENRCHHAKGQTGAAEKETAKREIEAEVLIDGQPKSKQGQRNHPSRFPVQVIKRKIGRAHV